MEIIEKKKEEELTSYRVKWIDGSEEWKKNTDLGNCIDLLIQYSAKKCHMFPKDAYIDKYIMDATSITVQWSNGYVVYLTIVTSQFVFIG